MGKPNLAPPLAVRSGCWRKPNRVIRIPLIRLTGPIQVKGQQYNFPAHGGDGRGAFD